MVTMYQVYSDIDLESNSGGIVVYTHNNYEYSIMIECIKYKLIRINFSCVIIRSPNGKVDNNKQ